MINNKQDLRRYIEADIAPFVTKRRLIVLWAFITKDFNFYRIRYLVHLRKLEYILRVHPRRLLSRWYHKWAKNCIGRMFSWEVPSFVCGAGLHLWHPNIVINDDAKIGENAIFHGNNCIGRRGDSDEDNVSPVIGNNLNLGFGAVIIGPVHLADDIVVGANSTVIKSCSENGAVLVGTPAAPVKRG